MVAVAVKASPADGVGDVDCGGGGCGQPTRVVAEQEEGRCEV